MSKSPSAGFLRLAQFAGICVHRFDVRARYGPCFWRGPRVAGPVSPHVVWTTALPVGVAGALAADATGSVYVSLSPGNPAQSNRSLDGVFMERVDAATGSVLWSTTLANAMPSPPVLLSTGAVDYAGFNDAGEALIDGVNPATGALQSSTPVNIQFFQPAVGADGTLYFIMDGGVTRIAADGTTLWVRAGLLPGDGEMTGLALGPDDLVLVSVAPSGGAAALFALDPASGATRWTHPLTGELADPVVRPDGSIAVLDGSGTDSGAGESLLVLEPTGEPRAVIDLGGLGVSIYAIAIVAQDGSLVLAGTDQDQSYFLVDLTSSGQLLWKALMPPGFLQQATIDVRGTLVVAAENEILGLSSKTGLPIWTLAAVNASGIVDATLTSAGGIVALETDGTLFGASD